MSQRESTPLPGFFFFFLCYSRHVEGLRKPQGWQEAVNKGLKTVLVVLWYEGFDDKQPFRISNAGIFFGLSFFFFFHGYDAKKRTWQICGEMTSCAHWNCLGLKCSFKWRTMPVIKQVRHGQCGINTTEVKIKKKHCISAFSAYFSFIREFRELALTNGGCLYLV